MKKIFGILVLVTGLAFQSCEKVELGNDQDFSNSLAPYVEITSKAAISAKEGANATIPVRMRTALQEAVTVEYEVTGAFTTTGTVTIPRNELTADAVITLPTGVVGANQTSVPAVFSIKRATAGGRELKVGHLPTASENRTINITKA